MRALLLCVALTALALASCAGITPEPLSPDNLESWCYMKGNESPSGGETMSGSSCDMSVQARFCADYRAAAVANHASRTACLDACDEVENRYWGEHQMDGCGNAISYGHRLCQRFCRQHYGE